MLKENKVGIAYKIYTMIYLTINICYVVLEAYKFRLGNLFETYNEVKYIHKVFSLSEISLVMEYLIIFINIFFLSLALYHDRKTSRRKYLNLYIVINLLVLMGIKMLSIILTKTLLIANGNLNQQNIFTGYITLIALVISVSSAVKTFLYHIQN